MKYNMMFLIGYLETTLIIIGILVILYAVSGVLNVTFPNLKKTLKKPIDVVQKKTADNDLDKKLDRLQKLGQLYKDGLITKDEFDEQKKKIKL